MTHRSRLGVVVIDCKGDDLAPAAAFWGGALGAAFTIDREGRYAVPDGRGQDSPLVLLQSVDHDSRVHLDIETDDQEAEAARLAALGATEVARTKGWIVMEAPTGHRFCLVKPQSAGFETGATAWGV